MFRLSLGILSIMKKGHINNNFYCVGCQLTPSVFLSCKPIKISQYFVVFPFVISALRTCKNLWKMPNPLLKIRSVSRLSGVKMSFP